ncbi:sterol desaturase family protein [Nocardia sp. NBC_01503]|uniref:sterol desaturase family protein n=1 Tax=Nocardia sp. NBC_01503 TaxID=2975997 RepID=UPI002E7B1C8F|nr:sterol desaturase family protein [Nocardia sp. NBC_01503]WTL29987.1 sterol desaturase family protein [Nocardia sp. NBC_01503]
MSFEDIVIPVLNASDRALYVLLAVDIGVFLLSRRRTRHPERRGYGLKDTATNMTLNIANGFILRVTEVLGGAAMVILAAAVTPLHWQPGGWGWLLAILLADLAYYWEHRTAHRVRLFWATHSVHHSSEHFNLSTANRLGLIGAMDLLGQLWYVPMALLGVPVYSILIAKAITLVYQIPLHTERVHRLWAPIEYLFNTPSHHRVHHGANNPYLDKNFGGVFMIWDRMFGTYAPELERVEFGLTRQIGTHNPLKVYTHEIRSLISDVRSATNWRDRAGYLFGPPGWQPRPTPINLTEIARPTGDAEPRMT